VTILTRIAVRPTEPVSFLLLTLSPEMAMNVDIAFHTPEAFFLKDARDEKFTLSGWDPSSYDHSGTSRNPSSHPSLTLPSSLSLHSHIDSYHSPHSQIQRSQARSRPLRR
jgi:hypothetical protein